MSYTWLANLVFFPLAIYAAIVLAAREGTTGATAWEKEREAYLASGETLDTSFRFAKPVPDEQNFGATAALAGINANGEAGDARREKLEQLALRHETIKWPRPKRQPFEPRAKCDLRALHHYFKETGLLEIPTKSENLAEDLLASFESRFGATIDSIVSGRDREHSVFLPLRSSLSVPGQMIFAEDPLPTSALIGISKGLRLHGLLSLHNDRPDEAAADVSSMIRVAEATSADSKSLIPLLISLSATRFATDVIWEGLVDHRWTETQLEELQSSISRVDLRRLMTDALRAELIGLLDAVDHIDQAPAAQLGGLMELDENAAAWTSLARFWTDHNRAAILSAFARVIASAKSDRGYLMLLRQSDSVAEQIADTSPLNMRVVFARVALPAYGGVIKNAARADAELTQAATACALERYFIANNAYPATLDELVPRFTKELPLDPVDHQPMRYRKTEDGRYQLHSIGWDGEDNNGGEGDITWNYKTKEQAD